MKKVLALLAIATMGLVACNKQPDPQPTPATATITASDVTVEEGKTVSVNATTNSTAPITYTVDNSGTYTVSDAGVVTGVKAGTGTLVLKVAAVEGKFTEASKTINVTVTAAPGPDPGYSGPVEGDSEWSLIGALLDKSWDTDWVAAKDGDIYVVKNVKLTTGDQFKFRKDKKWDENRGAEGDVEPFVLTTGEGQAVVNNGKNLSVAADGIYDIYYNAAKEQMAVCEPGKTPNWKDAPVAASITIDGNFEDWAALPAGSFSKYYGSEDATHPALTHCKVFATADYIYVYFEWDTEYTEPIPDVDHVPFHCYINSDGDATTGGFSDQFADACTDILLEGFIYPDGLSVGSYDPTAYAWEGEPNGSGWGWGDDILPEGGACEGAGIEGKYEFQIDRSVLADLGFPVADVFSIGFDIQKNWDSVGILPNEAPSEENPSGIVNSLQVTTQK